MACRFDPAVQRSIDGEASGRRRAKRIEPVWLPNVSGHQHPLHTHQRGSRGFKPPLTGTPRSDSPSCSSRHPGQRDQDCQSVADHRRYAPVPVPYEPGHGSWAPDWIAPEPSLTARAVQVVVVQPAWPAQQGEFDKPVGTVSAARPRPSRTLKRQVPASPAMSWPPRSLEASPVPRASAPVSS